MKTNIETIREARTNAMATTLHPVTDYKTAIQLRAAGMLLWKSSEGIVIVYPFKANWLGTDLKHLSLCVLIED